MLLKQIGTLALMAGLIALPTFASATCTGNGPLTIVSATDDGLYEEVSP